MKKNEFKGLDIRKNTEAVLLNFKSRNGNYVLVRRVSSLLLVGTMIISLAGCGNKKDKKSNDDIIPETTTEQLNDDYETIGLNELGVILNVPTTGENQMYGQVSGNIDPNKIVTVNGKNYVDKNSADNASNVGKTEIDTNNGKYTVDSNGKVKDKTPGYEIKDKNGNVVASGDSNGKEKTPDGHSIPNGYTYDKEIGKIVEEKEEGKYTYVDKNYYDPNTGDLVLSKGDLVSKEDLAKAKKELVTKKPTVTEPTTIVSTTKPTVTEPTTSKPATSKPATSKPATTEPATTIEPTTKAITTEPSTTAAQSSGYVDPNSGLKFKSKSDYNNWVNQGYEGFGEVNGVMTPITSEMEAAKKR